MSDYGYFLSFFWFLFRVVYLVVECNAELIGTLFAESMEFLNFIETIWGNLLVLSVKKLCLGITSVE